MVVDFTKNINPTMGGCYAFSKPCYIIMVIKVPQDTLTKKLKVFNDIIKIRK
jgi:hypothetical protein